MAGFLNAVSACLVLLMLMAVGYFMGVWGWMTAAEKNSCAGRLSRLGKAASMAAARLASSVTWGETTSSVEEMRKWLDF